MFYCYKCGTSLPDDSKFCNNCGATVQSEPQAQPQEQARYQEHYQPQENYQPNYDYYQPYYQQYPYGQPVDDRPKTSIAKAIVSIALSGEAIILAVLNFFYSLMFSSFGEAGGGLIFTVFFSFFVLPGAIVGLIFGINYLNSDAVRIRGLAKAGKIMGIISLILMGVSFIISIGGI